MLIYYDLDNEVFGPAFRQYHYYYYYYYASYEPSYLPAGINHSVGAHRITAALCNHRSTRRNDICK